jgi:L-Ala-D/L-Glu epimerase
MRAMRLLTYFFELPLRHPFTTSRKSTTAQETVVVELDDGQHRGFGEATANGYYGMTLEKIRAALNRVQSIVESHGPLDPPLLWETVAPELQDCPFALCAVDQAAYDLWGKQQGKPVYELWGLSTDHIPDSDFTIGIDSIDVMVTKLQEMPGWPIYKIKLGTSYDLEIIHELRKHTNALFRVDANCGWNADKAISLSHDLKSLNVEFIEQPLPAGDWHGYKRVFAESALPIIADESCIAEQDVAACHGHFHGINIKLMKCGGLTPARRMISHARNLGLKVMVGCMTESSVGISAIAQLLPLLDYVDMDGAVLLSQDIATGVRVENGHCRYPNVPGHGVMLI